MVKTGIIIQARMGSTRLPGKILKTINDRVLLKHIVDRLSAIADKATLVIATSDLPGDDVVEEWCKENNVLCFRGDEQNVLSRYFKCASKYGFSYIVRMTADNPFPDVEEVSNLIDFHINNHNDFSESFSVLPIGVGCEIFTFSTLEEDMRLATLPHHFEHVDEYILENLDDYKHGVLTVAENKNYPKVRLTVDTEEDYDRACFIAKNSKTGLADTEEAIRLAEEYEKV